MARDTRTCVITVNYKGAEDTAACIASLQQSAVPVSIVVVDNTPNDPELEEALSPYSDVQLIRAPENLGFGRGNNLGIEWALSNTNCEFIFILNNDATVESGCIEQLQNEMDKRSDVGLVTGRVVLMENPKILWYGGGDIDWKKGGGRVPGIFKSSESVQALTAREVDFASGCAMMIRRQVLNVVGGFDPAFFMYDEDVDLSIRIRKAGYKIYYLPHALVLHVLQGSQRDKEKKFVQKWSPDNPNYYFHIYHMVRNSIINARKHAKGKDFIFFVFYFAVYIIYKAGKVAAHIGPKAFTPVVKGVIDGKRYHI